MKKVIVKCKLKNRDKFEKKMTARELDFGAIYWQHERVYVPRNYEKQSSFPRLILRTEMKSVDRPPKYELELRRHIEDSGIDVVNTTVVKDYTEAANIAMQLGFECQAELSSRKQELTLKKGMRMYLDKMDGKPGYFVKIEADLKEGDSVEAVRSELMGVLDELGQSEDTVIKDTYAETL